jgi:hypothetical protein
MYVGRHAGRPSKVQIELTAVLCCIQEAGYIGMYLLHGAESFLRS